MSTRTQYDADLAALKALLAKMGQLSADAVEDALESLCTADAEGAKEIIKGDSEVNRMERDIEHRCMTLLLRQQPVASDLRFISAAMKVVTDVERIGDHAADIAEIVPHLAGVRKAGDPAVSKSIEMGRKAHKMLNDAMAAFAAEDEAAAEEAAVEVDAAPPQAARLSAIAPARKAQTRRFICKVPPSGVSRRGLRFTALPC